MAALRTAVFHLIQLITVIPYAFLCLLWAPLPVHWRFRLTVGWPRAMLWVCEHVVGLKPRVLGREHLPDGPAILLSKHQSTWETYFIAATMPRDVCFVFKRELLRVPFFGWGIALLDMIHIDRSKGSDSLAQVIAQGRRKLAEGCWIILFPEGTRTRVGAAPRYKIGGARLAVATGTPVVPIAVNSGEFWPKGLRAIRPGTVTLSIGAPIPSEGKTAEALNAEVREWIEAEMRRISPHAYRTPDSPTPPQVSS